MILDPSRSPKICSANSTASDPTETPPRVTALEERTCFSQLKRFLKKSLRRHALLFFNALLFAEKRRAANCAAFSGAPATA